MLRPRGCLSAWLSGDFRSGRAGEPRHGARGPEWGSVRDCGVTNRGVICRPPDDRRNRHKTPGSLERLTRWALQLPVADEAAGEVEEGLVEVGAAFVADAEAGGIGVARRGAFDDPAAAAESGAVGYVRFPRFATGRTPRQPGVSEHLCAGQDPRDLAGSETCPTSKRSTQRRRFVDAAGFDLAPLRVLADDEYRPFDERDLRSLDEFLLRLAQFAGGQAV